jgi:hypothetical protein
VSSGGTGNVNNGNVVTVTVSCTTNKFTVGGNVTGLTGTLVLLDNGGDNKTITANGPFTFTTPVFSGLTYAVTVSSKPPALTCMVTRGSGMITNANVTNVSVTCSDRNIRCGSNYCNAGSQVCCDPEGNAQCIGSAQPCGQLSLPCDDAANCGPGQVCCAMTHNGNGIVESASCASSCGGSNPVQLCALASECPSGSCSAYAGLPGYDACQ